MMIIDDELYHKYVQVLQTGFTLFDETTQKLTAPIFLQYQSIFT